MARIRFFKHYVRMPLIFLAGIEFFLLMGSVYIAANVRFTGSLAIVVGLESLPVRAAVFAGVILICMVTMGLFQSRLRERSTGILIRIIASFVAGVVVLALLFYIYPLLYLGRGILGISLATSLIFIVAAHLSFHHYAQDIMWRRVVVIGAGKRANNLAMLRRKSDLYGLKLLGYIPMQDEQVVVDEDRLLKVNSNLCDYALQQGVDEYVVAVDDRRKNFPLDDLLNSKMAGVRVSDILTVFEEVTGKIRLDLINPSWMVFSDGFDSKLTRDIGKRIFDVLAVVLIFLVTWPFMLVVAAAIFIESGFKGPIFYNQQRVGLGGHAFKVYKFRSMTVDAEQGGEAQWAQKKDARVTRVGNIIRLLRIDELPQIFNVLKGDMSMVGPRPERPVFVDQLSESIPYYGKRHQVKPGISGWAQLCYPYGSSENDAREKLQYDLYYIKNYSLFLDLTILLHTVEVVLFGKGAR